MSDNSPDKAVDDTGKSTGYPAKGPGAIDKGGKPDKGGADRYSEKKSYEDVAPYPVHGGNGNNPGEENY